MDLIKQKHVEKSDIQPLPYVDADTRVSIDPTETTVSVDINLWKGKIKGFFRRVAGQKR